METVKKSSQIGENDILNSMLDKNINTPIKNILSDYSWIEMSFVSNDILEYQTTNFDKLFSLHPEKNIELQKKELIVMLKNLDGKNHI